MFLSHRTFKHVVELVHYTYESLFYIKLKKQLEKGLFEAIFLESCDPLLNFLTIPGEVSHLSLRTTVLAYR